VTAKQLGFTKRQFWHSLAAVLLGNAVYFGLMRYLPPAGRHAPYKVDWGLAIDFWCCLVFYGVIDWVLRRMRR
jgi:hypothetical protein